MPGVAGAHELRLLPADGRVVNLSSAAQASVDLDALSGERQLDHGGAYAQSKLALTMWTAAMAHSLADSGPLLVAVNPGSLLATKMVLRLNLGIPGHAMFFTIFFLILPRAVTGLAAVPGAGTVTVSHQGTRG